MSRERMKRLVVLISGRGSNLEALLQARERGELAAEIAAVFSNRPQAAGLAIATAQGVATVVIDSRAFPDRAEFDRMLGDQIETLTPDLIVLAGFMRILSGEFISRFSDRILNIHPSLLPELRGLDTHRRALESGAREHGASVHFVTEELDAGPVLMQARVPIFPGDSPETLQARVLKQEHRLYPAALQKLLSGEMAYVNGRIVYASGVPLEAPLLLPTPF